NPVNRDKFVATTVHGRVGLAWCQFGAVWLTTGFDYLIYIAPKRLIISVGAVTDPGWWQNLVLSSCSTHYPIPWTGCTSFSLATDCFSLRYHSYCYGSPIF